MANSWADAAQLNSSGITGLCGLFKAIFMKAALDGQTYRYLVEAFLKKNKKNKSICEV